MAKGFWKIGGKTVSPLVWGGIGLGVWFVIKNYAEKKAEKEAYKGLAKLFERGVQPASNIVIPAGKTWIVKLKDDRQVTMNSVQLQQAIEAKAVKTYQLARSTA